MSKPFSEMTLEELKLERDKWQKKIDEIEDRPAATTAAYEFKDKCESWIRRREYDNSIKYLHFIYTNYKGECEERAVRPIMVWFGSTEWHPEPQWLLRAHDRDRGVTRDFAFKGIRGFEQ